MILTCVSILVHSKSARHDLQLVSCNPFRSLGIIVVVDTEMYSNTGGQCSKATPAGASVKFAMGGKTQKKKNIGEMFMTYEHCFVASVALSNQAQTLQAFLEADRHNGPSIIIAYAPCVQQGVRPQGLNDMVDECRFAVDSGYWPLYRYNPDLVSEGKNPFILDSKKLRKDVKDFLKRESRFVNLRKKTPEVAEGLWNKMNNDVHRRMEHLGQLASGYKSFGKEEAPVLVLFASETGNAARVALDFSNACTLSGIASAMDDVAVDDIDGKTVVFFVSTCRQGSMPANGKQFYDSLRARTKPFKDGSRFMVFGLGDSSYYFFAKAAKEVESRMQELGAKKMIPLGFGDDSAEGGLDGGLQSWMERVWPALELEPPEEVPHILPLKCIFSNLAILSPSDDSRAIEQYYAADAKTTSATIISNSLMCRPDYSRDFRTIQISKGDLHYTIGDALEIFPINDVHKVEDFLHEYSADFGDHTVIQMHSFGIDGDVSLSSLFTYVFDVFGKPSKHFMHELATFETSEAERAIMLNPEFLNTQGKRIGITIADVLLRFKAARPPLPALLAMIPRIKPRAYSIASSPNALKDKIELLVLVETWWCDAGMRYGLNCDMLRQLQPGNHVWCRIKAGSMEPPEPDHPVVCAGIGSGLAPHMAFLRDRVFSFESGQAVAPFSLFFGNRYLADEFLYRSELEMYATKYDWFSLHTAFSRDDPQRKVYVQDLVAMTDDARRLLRETLNGRLYVCGNRQLPKPLQEALIKSFTSGSVDPVEHEKAAADMERLYLNGRAQQEVW